MRLDRIPSRTNAWSSTSSNVIFRAVTRLLSLAAQHAAVLEQLAFC